MEMDCGANNGMFHSVNYFMGGVQSNMMRNSKNNKIKKIHKKNAVEITSSQKQTAQTTEF
jgi:hypothetical protein